MTKRFKTLWQQIQIKIIHLNLFKTSDIHTDPYDLKTSIISTRIYLLFLCLSITILTASIGFQYQVRNITVHNPSQTIYENLYHKYPTTLHCPCSQIAIPYNSFLSLSPVYHPVCSSLYISIYWINSITGETSPHSYVYQRDFHSAGQAFFITLDGLCSLSRSTLSHQLYSFNRSTLITNEAIPRQELIIRANNILNQFESITIDEFRRTLSFIRFYTQTMFSTSRGNADLYTFQLLSNNTQVILVAFFLFQSNYSRRRKFHN